MLIETKSLVDWKNRYAELVEQLDRQQERYKKRQALLSAGLKSSARLARGLDKRADKSLLAIQALLRQKDLKNVDLEVAVTALEKQSEQSVENRNKNLKRAMKAIKKIASQTRSLSINLETNQSLKQIESELDGKDQQIDQQLEQLPEQLEALTVLHRAAMRQGKKRSGRSIWRSWLSSGPESEEEVLEVELPNESEELDEDEYEIDDEELAQEQAETASASPELRQTASSVTSPVAAAKSLNLSEVINTQFTTLLQFLGRSDDLRILQSSMNDKLSLDEIKSLTSAVCGASIDAVYEDRQAVRSSIQRLNSRIGKSMNHIDACRTIDEGNQSANKQLHLTIEKGCSSIEASLAGAKTLDELKNALGGNLEAMKNALAAHQAQAEQHGMSGSLNSLAQQMAHVQDVSRATLFRLDTQAREALSDAVTGLPNRAAFRVSGPETFKSMRQSASPLSVAVFIIDHCQQVKKDLEPQDLDTLFKSLAGLCRQGCRDGDLVFRLGEDEFAILLPNSECQAAAIFLDALRQKIAQTAMCPSKVTVSVGIVECRDADTAESALARAKRVCTGAATPNSTSIVPG
jgi:diguanylate cyclase (GGDEF)-like protein